MAAFGSLSDRLNDTFDRLRGKGKLTEADINAAMREIRMALLEADVNYRVVKDFVTRTKERCLASEVMESLTPAQNVVKIVLDELDGAGRFGCGAEDGGLDERGDDGVDAGHEADLQDLGHVFLL